MKAGDYVRLPDGIHKIKHYEYRPEYENCHCLYLDDNDYGLLFTDKDLIKSSPNIIDLIEEGDIVNYGLLGGGMVIFKKDGEITTNTILFSNLKELQSLLKKESSLKQLCNL